MTEPSLREEIAAVLEQVVKDGLPGPRDLDVALDAILSSVKTHVNEQMLSSPEAKIDWEKLGA